MPFIPPLRFGERLTAEEFERRFDATPGLKHAELIEGIVRTLAPQRPLRLGEAALHLTAWLGYFEAFTPGIEGACRPTLRLAGPNRPQPQALLIISPERGGQTCISEDDYLEGGPELVGEVALDGDGLELHEKFHLYQRNGVREYVVWLVSEQQVDWFVLRNGRYERLQPEPDGILHSEVFPGLWLDIPALVRGDVVAVLATLQRGLATVEHAEFVTRLHPPVPPAS
jgi:hypothetical protein